MSHALKFLIIKRINVDPVCGFDKSWVKQFCKEEDHISLSGFHPIWFSKNNSLQRHQTCLLIPEKLFFSFCDNSFRFNSVYEESLSGFPTPLKTAQQSTYMIEITWTRKIPSSFQLWYRNLPWQMTTGWKIGNLPCY